MNRFPLTIIDYKGAPALITRAYSGSLSVYRCLVERMGDAVAYKASKERIGRFPDLAALSEHLMLAFQGDGVQLRQTAPAAETQTKLRRVDWLVPRNTPPTACGLMASTLASKAAEAGYHIETVCVEPAPAGKSTGLVAYKGASQDVMATVQLCHVAAKCKGVQ